MLGPKEVIKTVQEEFSKWSSDNASRVRAVLVATTLIGGTGGCARQYVGEDVERSAPSQSGTSSHEGSDEVSGKAYTARNSEYQPLMDQLVSLEGALVTFINNTSYYYNSETDYYYLNDEKKFKDLQSGLIKTQGANLDQISRSKNGTLDIMLTDYAEQLGEARGVVFGAWRGQFGSPGKIRFDGEGLNELHGCLEKTKAVIRILAKQD